VAIRFYFAVFILALFLVPLEALADIIVLSNGDRITGKVLEFSGGRLRFHTEYAGELRIDWKDIRSVETEDLFFVQVKEGPVIRARIRMAGEEMWLEDEEGASHPMAQENVLGFYSHSPKHWTMQYDLGYQQAKGNATISDLRTSLKLKVKRQRDDLLLATSYARGKTDGEVSADRWDIQSKYNRLLNSKLYGTTIFLLERDRLRDIDRRWQVGPGVGYRFYDTGILFLSTDIGTVWEKTRYEPAGSESKLKGFWGLDFFYVFWGGIKVEETFRWIQGSTEGSDYEINSETGLNVPLYENLFLKASLVNRYDNKPQPGLKKYDRSFITSLSYIASF
jgi:putative salt-induced outer membrane protein YdiY